MIQTASQSPVPSKQPGETNAIKRGSSDRGHKQSHDADGPNSRDSFQQVMDGMASKAALALPQIETAMDNTAQEDEITTGAVAPEEMPEDGDVGMAVDSRPEKEVENLADFNSQTRPTEVVNSGEFDLSVDEFNFRPVGEQDRKTKTTDAELRTAEPSPQTSSVTAATEQTLRPDPQPVWFKTVRPDAQAAQTSIPDAAVQLIETSAREQLGNSKYQLDARAAKDESTSNTPVFTRQPPSPVDAVIGPKAAAKAKSTDQLSQIPSTAPPAPKPADAAGLPRSGAVPIESFPSNSSQPNSPAQAPVLAAVTTSIAQQHQDEKAAFDAPRRGVERRLDTSQPQAHPLQSQTSAAQVHSITAIANKPATPSINTVDEGHSFERLVFSSERPAMAELALGDSPAALRAQLTTLLQQPDLPRNVALQIAQAMRQGAAERAIEITLNPTELGRVRLSMLGTEGAMTVQVTADRPETLDLLRRNIDVLAQEFQDIGFDASEFNFAQNPSEHDDTTQDDPRTQSDALDEMGEHDLAENNSAPRSSLVIDGDRVDIRI